MNNLTIGGRYRKIGKIGDGGFGETFLAEDLQLPGQPKCVIKQLKPQQTDDESIAVALRLFEQEVEVLYRLGENSQIPKLLAHIIEKGEFYLVQEFIDGRTLEDEINSGRIFNEAEATEILRQLLEVLSFVHASGVIHRDVKPANIMRRKADGKIILIDFGAVKQVRVFPSQSVKRSTIAIGSDGFMPGEQLAGKPRFASDVYAAGLVIVQLLTGVHPSRLRQSQRTGEFIWQDKVSVSHSLASILDRMICYDYRHRFQTAGEVLKSLKFSPANFHAAPVKTMAFAGGVHQVDAPVATPFTERTIVAAPQKYLQAPTFLPPNLNQPRAIKPPGSVGNLIVGLVFSGVAVAIVCVIALIIIVASWSANAPKRADVPENFPIPPSSGYSVYQEALQQGVEAKSKSQTAVSKSDWEGVARQCERAVKLLESIGYQSDDFVAAQNSLVEYRLLLDKAREQVAKLNSGVAANAPSMQTPLIYSPKSDSSSITFNSVPSASSQPTTRKAAMPAPRKERTYLVYDVPGLTDRPSPKRLFFPADGDFTARIGNSGAYNGAVTINFDGGPDRASVDFAAPRNGRLYPGTYEGAQRYPFQSPTKPGLDFSYNGSGCNELNGKFTIYSIVYNSTGDKILQLDASFARTCYGDNWVYGRIRYDYRDDPHAAK